MLRGVSYHQTYAASDAMQLHSLPIKKIDLSFCCNNLIGEADDTASGTATGVTGLEGVLVATLAEVVLAGVDDERAADNGVGADERDVLVCGLAE